MNCRKRGETSKERGEIAFQQSEISSSSADAVMMITRLRGMLARQDNSFSLSSYVRSLSLSESRSPSSASTLPKKRSRWSLNSLLPPRKAEDPELKFNRDFLQAATKSFNNLPKPLKETEPEFIRQCQEILEQSRGYLDNQDMPAFRNALRKFGLNLLNHARVWTEEPGLQTAVQGPQDKIRKEMLTLVKGYVAGLRNMASEVSSVLDKGRARRSPQEQPDRNTPFTASASPLDDLLPPETRPGKGCRLP